MTKHKVTFYSPGTFVHETSTREIDSWDVDQAIEMAKGIVERYGAVPFGFEFSSSDGSKSGMHFLGGTLETLAEVKARATDDDRILISNMECNGWDRIITNTNSWKIVQPFLPGDKLIESNLAEAAKRLLDRKDD